jgi:acyl-CoA synthetase (AMP-forming)/AMP-acid ligase II
MGAMITRSTSPDVSIPDITITEFVLRQAARLADKPALIDGPSGRTLNYAQLVDGIRRTATALSRRGFKKGDVFAVYSPNLPEYAIVFLGVAMLGGTVTTVNPLYTAGELANQLKDCKAKLLITVPMFLDKAKEAAAAAGGVGDIYVFGEADGARSFKELLEAPPDPPAVTINPREDVVALPYSSGTTGLPKGVMLTHRNLVANLLQCQGMKDWECFGESDRVFAALPFFHIYGMVVIMMLGLANGSTIVSMPRFDFGEFLAAVQKYKLTVLPLVPPIVLGMVKSPAVAQFDLSSVRLIFSGAAPLGADQARELSEKMKCPVTQGYGMTEASPVTHLAPTRNNRKPGSAGRVVPNTEVKIVNPETREELGPNKEGELLMRGPQIMKGYLGKPEDTANSIDRDGWYHTGDVGYVDDEGWFYIVDRTKELIKYKGMQVAPAELEALLLTHPAILDAAVTRRPDEEAGEIPKAYVVLKPDDESKKTPADAIMAWVAGKVAPHKRIRQLEFIDAIPKSASGKILRRVLVDMEKQRG